MKSLKKVIPIQNWAKNMNTDFTKEKYKAIINAHKKPTSLVKKKKCKTEHDIIFHVPHWQIA